MATTPKDCDASAYDSRSLFGDFNLQVSLTDFGTKEQHSIASEPSCVSNYSNYETCPQQAETKNEMTLDLSLNKSGNLFDADLTPTPTRFIKNCDEVGLFEDLRHLNPFDEGFRRAAEKNSINGPLTPTTQTCNAQHGTQNDEGESLHTPQVYPLDVTQPRDYCSSLSTKTVDSVSPLDVPMVTEILDTSPSIPLETESTTNTITKELPPSEPQSSVPIQIIQPQVITWLIPAQVQTIATTDPMSNTNSSSSSSSAIPVQTVRPFLLPKPTESTKQSQSQAMPVSKPAPSQQTTIIRPSICVPPITQTQHEPSSASLTPTSQLPIKERLKAILNNTNNKMRNFEDRECNTAKSAAQNHSVPRVRDCMERKRAAAKRYRNKIRDEHKDLRKRNEELLLDNKNLKQRIRHLEQTLRKQSNCTQCSNIPSVQDGGVGFHATNGQIQIPPSSIHLVINVPKMIVPAPELTSHHHHQSITK